MNSIEGFSRRVSSQNGGVLVRGTQGIVYLLSQSGTGDLAFPLTSLQTLLTYAVGTLEPVSGSEAQPVQFFTNRTGRMAASRVAPGRYRVVLSGQTASIGEVVVPEEGAGVIDVGELRPGGSR